MNYLEKQTIKKILILSCFLIIFGIFIIILLFKLEIQKSENAILEVDEFKNLSIKFSTSNIGLITTKKDLYINIESKSFVLKDIEFINQGNNVYRIVFNNDELYKLVKTNSLYEIKIFYSSKKLYEFIFNI